MSDDTRSTDVASGAPGRRGLIRSIVHRLAGEEVALPVEGRLPSFEGATGWLNCDPLTPEHQLRPGRCRELRRASRLHAAGTAAPE
jgi:hypothetical protein